MSGIVEHAGLRACCGAIVASAVLAGCARDPIVTTAGSTMAGNWQVEHQVDRISGAPIPSAILLTRKVSNGKVLFPGAATMQLSCFKTQPAALFHFPVKIGSNRNGEFAYRFDDKPGHIGKARFIDDYRSVVIEDKTEMTRFVGEMATSKVLYVLIRSLNEPRTSAEFSLEGAPDAIKAGLAGCPLTTS